MCLNFLCQKWKNLHCGSSQQTIPYKPRRLNKSDLIIYQHLNNTQSIPIWKISFKIKVLSIKRQKTLRSEIRDLQLL